jgi:hypothetical protein
LLENVYGRDGLKWRITAEGQRFYIENGDRFILN